MLLPLHHTMSALLRESKIYPVPNANVVSAVAASVDGCMTSLTRLLESNILNRHGE